MNPAEFRKRTKVFALRAIRLVEALPKPVTCDVIGRQLLRSATSVGSNYRSACRAKSRADFIAKMKIVEEECDESLYWFDLLIETGKVKASLIENLAEEGEDILSMVVASIKTSRSHRNDESPTVNRQSGFVNRESGMVDSQSSIVNRKSSIVKG